MKEGNAAIYVQEFSGPVLYINLKEGTVDVSYSHGKGHHGLCPIEMTLKSANDLDVARLQKESGYYFVGYTDKEGNIPEYIKESIGDSRLSRLVERTEEGAAEKMIFVRIEEFEGPMKIKKSTFSKVKKVLSK